MSDEETLKRNKLLLKLMMHNYDEEVSRNELVDSKNSQMIVLTGAMLTLQATLFSNILVGNIISNDFLQFHWKVLSSLLMIISLILYVCSMYSFINAYVFKKKFRSAPSTKILMYYKNEECDYLRTINDLLEQFKAAIDFNEKLINDKVAKGNDGLDFLKVSVLFTVLLLIVFLIVLFL